MRIFLTALLVLTTLLAAATAAQAQGKTELDSDRMLRLRKAMDKAGGCPDEQTLRAMGSNTDSLLVNLLNSKDAPIRYRLWAVDCLGNFNNKRSRQLLASLLGDPTWDKVYRLRAMGAAARAMGVEILEDLKETCEDRDAETRAAAARAIGWIQTPRARSFLKHLQTRERDPAVIQAIGEALKRIPEDPYRPEGKSI